MKERSSRYATSAGSEEIEVVPERQDNDENCGPSDDDYSSPSGSRTSANNKKRSTAYGSFDGETDNNSPFNNQPMLTTSTQDISSLNPPIKSKYGLLRPSS